MIWQENLYAEINLTMIAFLLNINTRLLWKYCQKVACIFLSFDISRDFSGSSADLFFAKTIDHTVFTSYLLCIPLNPSFLWVYFSFLLSLLCWRFSTYHLEYLLTYDINASACHILRQINAFLGFIKQLKATTAKIGRQIWGGGGGKANKKGQRSFPTWKDCLKRSAKVNPHTSKHDTKIHFLTKNNNFIYLWPSPSPCWRNYVIKKLMRLCTAGTPEQARPVRSRYGLNIPKSTEI